MTKGFNELIMKTFSNTLPHSPVELYKAISSAAKVFQSNSSRCDNRLSIATNSTMLFP